MSRHAMKISLALSIMTALLLGYSNCSNPKYSDSGANPYASMSSNSNELTISPAGKTIGLNGSVTLSAGGGTAPYRFRLSSGGGSLVPSSTDPSEIVYKAPSVDTHAVIEVEDVSGKIRQAVIEVSINASSTLTLSYTPAGAVNINSVLTLAASGGTAPYSYFMYSGVGSISANKYTATSFGPAVIGVRDSVGRTSTFSINVGSSVTIVTKPIYRLYNSNVKQYLYSKSTTAEAKNGYVLNPTTAVFKVLEGTYLSSVQLLRCYIPSNGGRYLSTSGTCGSYTNEGSLGNIWTYAAPNSVPLYNCFKSTTGTYLTTTDYSICVNNGFNVQSTLGHVPQ